MKILLTGPTGFIGSAFLRPALAAGHEIAALAVPGEPLPSLPSSERLRWLRGTLAEAPWHEVERFQPEVCVHTAWVTAPGEYLESPLNHQFVTWSREFIRRACACGTRHIVVLGTCAEYQTGRLPLSEATTPLAPASTYARCKNVLREGLEADARGRAFTLCWARVFYPYGVGEHPARLCTSLVRQLARGEKVRLKTPHGVKDYIYITDLAAALLRVVEARFVGPINLGTGVGVAILELARAVASALNKPGLVEESGPASPDPLDCVVAENARLCSLGWQPQVSLEAGLTRLIGALIR